MFQGMFGDASLMITLNIMYRQHPGLCHITSQLAYKGLFLPGTPSAKRPAVEGFDWPNSNVPAAMICMSSTETTQGTSIINIDEATRAIQVAIKILRVNDSIDPSEIVIISPYSAQVKYLQAELVAKLCT